ncbi:hypothetical protein, partial [Paenarthrobacter nicotinovorans]|uniref:hypothetical protein n=1 Tax=Paenarthrobacter nicotinovorans TaxID=29320 RepID=UPI000A718687
TRTVKVPRAALGAVTERLAVTEGLAVTVAAEGTTLTITGRTVTERLAVSTIVVEGTAVIAITTRTVKVPRAALGAVTERLAVTVATEGTTLTITGRTVTERTTFAVTGRTVTTITKRLSITIPTERTTLTITGRTVTTVVVERTTLTITSRTIVAVPVFPGTESARISTGIVVGAVRTAVVPVPAEVSAIAAAIAAVVLSHGGFLLLRADHWRVRSRS